MTFREANNMIDDISWFYGGESITTDDIVECREICHKALEKQIPKKPYSDNDNGIYEKDCCPTCHRSLFPNDHHCRCGQKLDWSDTENDY